MATQTTATKPAGSKPKKRRTTPVENDAYTEMMERCIRAFGKRVASGDVEDVGRMLRLAKMMDDELRQAVRQLNAAGESWANIARGAGFASKQAAQQRWGDK